MAEEATRQICGNCGAPNAPDAVICIVCGAVLSAYAQPQPPVLTTTTTPPPAATTPAPANPSTTAGEWRGMFETKPDRTSVIPEPPPDLDVDDLLEAPTMTTIPTPALQPQPRTSLPPTTTPAPVTTPPPTRLREERPRLEAATRRPASARPASWERPKADPRFNRRRPQGMVGIGLFLLLLGCLLTGILSAAGADDAAILAFLCLTSLGFVAIVIAIVIWISRKEGRGG